jgi:hypothetical protein
MVDVEVGGLHRTSSITKDAVRHLGGRVAEKGALLFGGRAHV